MEISEVDLGEEVLIGWFFVGAGGVGDEFAESAFGAEGNELILFWFGGRIFLFDLLLEAAAAD